MQPINLTRDFESQKKIENINVPAKVDFSEAYELCLLELKVGNKPTPTQLMEWLKKNNLQLDIKNFLDSMCKRAKGSGNEDF